EFDSFWFVQQWPPAVCSFQKSGSCPGSGLRTFTIHGLWPQQSGTSLTNCPGSPFDITKISHLQSQLNTLWPTVLRANNQQFWSHEWTKHGTCSESTFNQAAYFKLAVDMRNNYDIIGALRPHAAGPNGRTKSRQAIKGFLKAKFGKFPGLRCRTDPQTKVSYLVEVVACFAQDGSTLIDCTRDTCGANFIF
uniref:RIBONUCLEASE MC1 n=1 Tax=Momordica charantia TaxID=3673 RepID=UPI000019AD39|nr:Chain A, RIBONUCLEASE MC1 [Momordica charantia]